MTVKSRNVTVTTAASELTSSVSHPAVYLRRSNGSGFVRQVVVRPETEIFVGGADVTTANGWSVSAYEVHSFELYGDDRLYACSASGSITVNVLESGL